MASLRHRIERIEECEGQSAGHPVPEGGVVFSGARDPTVIMRALGLGDVPAITMQVLDEGVPGDQPRLVGPLSEAGAYGQCQAHADLRRQGGGKLWSFHWRRGGLGWVLDWSNPEGEIVREFLCEAVDG